MAHYDRSNSSSAIGFIYGNLGDLLNSKGFFRQVALEREPAIQKDTLIEVKEKMGQLEDLHKRLDFMLAELEGLVR